MRNLCYGQEKMEKETLIEKQKQYIRGAAEVMGITSTELARLAKLSPSTLNRFLATEPAHALSHLTISRIEEASKILFEGAEKEGEVLAFTQPQSVVPKIPVIGYAKGGMDGLFFENGTVIDYVDRPPFLGAVRDAFAVRCVGGSMMPRYFPDDILYINPALGLKPEAFVVIEKNDGEALVKKFMQRDNGHFVFQQYNPTKAIRIKAEDIKRIYRIVGSSEG